MIYLQGTELIPFLIKFGLALAVLLYGSWTDLKTREVPDWINYGLLITGLCLNALFTAVLPGQINAINSQRGTQYILAQDSYFIQSLLGLSVYFAIAYIMFYAGQWGGGDSKMLMGLGAMIGLDISFNEPQFIAGFFVNVLFIGALYGLLWSFGLIVKNRKKFTKEFHRNSKVKNVVLIKKLLLVLCVLVLVFLFAIKKNEMRFVLLCALLVAILTFYLWICVKSIEKISMYKLVEPSKLTEGDWIVKDIKVSGKYIAGPSDLGIEKSQIKKLIELYKLGKIKKVLIKEGIPFVPSFLIAFVFTLFFGNLLWVLF